MMSELKKIYAKINDAARRDEKLHPPAGFHKILRMLFINKVFPVKHLNVDSFVDFLNMLADLNRFLGKYHRFVEDVDSIDCFTLIQGKSREYFTNHDSSSFINMIQGTLVIGDLAKVYKYPVLETLLDANAT